MSVIDDDDLLVVLNGRYAAPAWLSVALAASTSKDDPIFYRVVAVEFFPHGVRLVATDRYLVLAAWVPAVGHEADGEPDAGESPLRTVAARDTAHRGTSLMKHVLSLLPEDPDDEGSMVEVALSLGKADPPSYRGMEALNLEGLLGLALQIDVPGREALRLPLFEGEWSNWRSAMAAFVPRQTRAIAFNLTRLGQLAGLGPLHPGDELVWRFGGANACARVEIGTPPLEVVGVIMPVRWAFGEQEDEG